MRRSDTVISFSTALIVLPALPVAGTLLAATRLGQWDGAGRNRVRRKPARSGDHPGAAP